MVVAVSENPLRLGIYTNSSAITQSQPAEMERHDIQAGERENRTTPNHQSRFPLKGLNRSASTERVRCGAGCVFQGVRGVEIKRLHQISRAGFANRWLVGRRYSGLGSSS